MYSVIEAPSAAPTRRTYLVAGALFTVFAVYGSLVPFQFHPLPFDEALFRFTQVRYLELGIASRADFVANILLFIPFGFLFMGALRTDREDPVGTVFDAVAVLGAAFGLSVAIEFAQEFFPPRTVSLNDLAAETAGAIIGIAVWSMAGQRFTEWVRALLSERDRPAFHVRLLMLYAAVFFIAQVLPLDVTIDLGELAQKYRQGRIVLVPVAYGYESMVTRLWDWTADVALHIPIGALAVVGWTESGRHRRAGAALFLGLVFAVSVELCQLFVFTRYADVTDLFINSMGVALGVAAGNWIRSGVAPEGRSPSRSRVWPVAGALAWTVVIWTYHWFPFDFVVTRAMLAERLPMLTAAPFHSYYFGSEFHAFTEVSRKLVLAVPLGALLKLASPQPRSRPTARVEAVIILTACGVLFLGIELGQLFLPDRIPDLTDVGIAAAGVSFGIWLAARSHVAY